MVGDFGARLSLGDISGYTIRIFNCKSDFLLITNNSNRKLLKQMSDEEAYPKRNLKEPEEDR